MTLMMMIEPRERLTSQMDNRSCNRLFERGGKAERALLLDRFLLNMFNKNGSGNGASKL
jgi:hypothetical protein